VQQSRATFLSPIETNRTFFTPIRNFEGLSARFWPHLNAAFCNKRWRRVDFHQPTGRCLAAGRPGTAADGCGHHSGKRAVPNAMDTSAEKNSGEPPESVVAWPL
jgi:hypothetical protein